MITIALLLVAGDCFAQDPAWQVPAANVRFELELTDQPSEPCAGIVAILPDGGLLPRGTPAAVVLGADGAELRSESLWHNPAEGFALVFAPPASGGSVWVYFRSATTSTASRPDSPFCPSLLLYTQPARGGLEAARALARDNPPGRTGRMGLVDNIGEMENPYGSDDNYVSYYTGWLKPPAAGSYYIATISDEGSECAIDGQTVASWPGTHSRQEGARGKFGRAVALGAKRHRIEYFHFEQTGAQEMHLVWRSPGQPAEDLPATVPGSAFLQSGRARIRSATTRAGTPLAISQIDAESYLWLGDRPINLYRLRVAQAERQLPGTVYDWNFGDERQLTGPEVFWLLEGEMPVTVQLTARSPQGTSQSARTLYYNHPPGASSVNNPTQRERWRRALLQRCQAVPAARRPCENWSPDLWATLFAVIEPYQGGELLQEIFNRSRADVLELKAAERWPLEDLFWSTLRSGDAVTAQAWLERFLKEEQDNARRFYWSLQRIEFWMYERNDLAQARRAAESLRATALAAGLEASVRWLVRGADIERLAGNVDAARRLYTQAADRYHTGKTDWRAETVRQGTYYETARHLLDQQAFLEAQAVLRKWELEFPLSKLEGDYPLIEAACWKAIGRCDQAVRILQAYRKAVALSNSLPDAMKLELDCLVQLKRYDDVKALADDINKRFPNLELAQQARQRLAELKP